MGRGRVATLVVLDKHSDVLGVSDPIALSQPWWPEVRPIIDLMPNAVVLRLLHATPDDGGPMGGTVSYLVQVDGDVNLKLHPWHGHLESHPLRMPWANPGQAAADIAWVSKHVQITGTPRQCKSWNLSSIWSFPTSQGTVWLKCVPAFFEHEADVIRSLPANAGPSVLAVDGHRMLFAAMPGVDGFDASESEFKRMIKALVELQLASVTGVDELVQLGVPDCRGEQLLQPLADLVHRLAPHSLPLQRLVEELPQRLHIANNAGFPDTLVHGDAHSGNCRLGSAQPIWFDWGDSFVGHPLYDLATIESSHPVVLEAWLKVWAEKLPASDPHTAWAALAPVAKLRKAFVYQQFVDKIEPSEHIYHADDPSRILHEIAAHFERYTVAYSTIHPA